MEPCRTHKHVVWNADDPSNPAWVCRVCDTPVVVRQADIDLSMRRESKRLLAIALAHIRACEADTKEADPDIDAQIDAEQATYVALRDAILGREKEVAHLLAILGH